MNEIEPSLFDLPNLATARPEPLQEMPISDPQVATIRQAFAEAGIADMTVRQEIIQSCSTRPIANIRELYAREVRVVLFRIEKWGIDESPTGSAWDTRDEDTWIDKL